MLAAAFQKRHFGLRARVISASTETDGPTLQHTSSYEATYRALAVCMAAQVPVILWGAPGQGKTTVLKRIAEEQGRHLEVILASIREPQDFAGLPVVMDGSMRLAAPDWAKRLSEIPDGILFLDEVNTAPPSVQSALLRVSLDRVAGDCALGAGTSVVAAANPPDQAADGWDLAAPLANRFCHLDWELPADVVRAGFSGNWPHFSLPNASPADATAAAEGELIRIGSFLGLKPQLITKLPDTAAEQGRAFPTPRSWETLARLLGWAAVTGAGPRTEQVLVTGAVGQAAGSQYLVYRDEVDLPDPEQLLADPQALKLPRRTDKVYVISAATIAAVRRNPTPDRWIAAGHVLERIAAAGHTDMAVSFGKEWKSLRPAEASDPSALVDLRGLLDLIVPLMAEARML